MEQFEAILNKQDKAMIEQARKELKEVLDDEVAALMLTNPSTLGLFEKNIKVSKRAVKIMVLGTFFGILTDK